MFTLLASLLFAASVNAIEHHDLNPVSTIDVFTHQDFFGSGVIPGDFRNAPINPFLVKNYFKHSCASTEACLKEALIAHPSIILIKSELDPTVLLAYVAPQGINSIFEQGMFKTLRDFLLTPHPKSAVFYSPKIFYNAHLSHTPLFKFILPDNFKMSDLHLLAHNSDEIPVLALFESADFDKFNFHSVKQFAKLNVFPDIIEPVPRLFSIPHTSSPVFH
uniref:Serosal cuticle-related protein 3 n=1 Tax=Nilaparvata lugens TaxID=108931 RepID=A0A6G5SXC5_NILLU|nr:serosal cuticle-related protein 3 [Nilaparvata lugens]